jgi:hypothetical protein
MTKLKKSFNPTMVRLLPSRNFGFLEQNNEKGAQNGSRSGQNKWLLTQCKPSGFSCRRPLMVGSEHNPAPNASAANASFNPTMVRLLLKRLAKLQRF